MRAADRQVQASGQLPKDRRERRERHDRAQQSESERPRAIYEKLQVACNALVGIVDMRATELEMEIGAIVEPFGEVMVGQPTPPADLEHLAEIRLVHGEDDVHGGQHAEIHELVREQTNVELLERVVEPIVPIGEQYVHVDKREIRRDDDREQAACGPALLRDPVGADERGEGAKELQRHRGNGARNRPPDTDQTCAV